MKKPEQFIRHPAYPGGTKALDFFIKSNLRYPKEALEKRIEGSVIIRFDVVQNGNIANAEVRKGLSPGCDEEALRIVRMLKYETRRHRGLKVIFHKTIVIHFILPPALVINYEYRKKAD